MVEMPVKMYVAKLMAKAKDAARPMALLSGPVKDKALGAMADHLLADEEWLLTANREDLDSIAKSLEGETNKDTVREAVERVRLTGEALAELAESLRRVAVLPDPVGEVTRMWRRPNGMQVSRVRVPIGVIGVITDLGPRALVESAALCLKAGNVCVFRGGAEAFRTNGAVAASLAAAAAEAGLPAGALSFVERTEREAALELLRMTKHLDAIIPRGGAGLRRTVVEQSRLPVLCHDGGVCHIYVDADADQPLAQNIVVNSKLQRPGAANSADTLLVHQAVARTLLPGLLRRLLDEFKVDVRGCPKTVALTGTQAMTGHKAVEPATEEDWGRQFQSRTIAIKLVKDMDEALDHIARYGPGQTDTIVTRDYAAALRFAREADSGAVLINASTREHEGEEFGLGPAIGISVGRVHARGPLGVEGLTCEKYVVLGTGQLRQPHPVPVTYEDAIMLKRPS